MSNTPDATDRNVAEQMPAAAAEFVEGCKSAGIALDYLPRTLPLAEKFAKSTPAHADRLAAYFGEVVRRETQGFWFDNGGVPMIYAGVEPYVNPAEVISALLANGRIDVEGKPLPSSKAYCEFITRKQREWIDRVVRGNYESVTALRTAMAADAKTAGVVLALAERAILTAQLDWSEALDGEVSSLDALERLLSKFHDLLKRHPERISAELIESTSKMMGVYLGEIIRRQYGGQWRMSPEGDLELPYPNVTINPIGRVRKRIVDGPSDNVKMYFNSMQRVIVS